MRLLSFIAAAALLILSAGCGGQSPGLLGRMPRGYDAYITIDPEKADLAGILAALEDKLPDYAIEDIRESDIGLDPFDWSEWKTELGLEDGEIGILGLSDKMEFLAFFLPCGDGEKLRSFVENSGAGEAEFLEMDEYTVMVINWNDDDQIDELEEALAGEPLSSDETFASMMERAQVDGPAVSFVFFQEITEVPVLGMLARSQVETVLSIAVEIEDGEFQQYSGMMGEGLQSNSIRIPENTMAATRTTIDMDWLISEYDELDGVSRADIEDIENGLPFIGFDSMEEFLAAFQGDFCVTVSEIELDSYGEFETGSGLIAISLAEPELLEAALSTVSSLAGAETERNDDFTAYLIEDSSQEIWFFISDGVLYITINIEPDEVTGGIAAQDFFSGSSSDGFMGGLADPGKVLRGISMDSGTEELIQNIFSGRAEFSISVDGDFVSATIYAGPAALESLIMIAVEMEQ